MRNVEMIRAEGIRQVRGPIPREVRRELMQAVKQGLLVRLSKGKLMSEIFCRPDLVEEARQMQKAEFFKSVEAIKGILV